MRVKQKNYKTLIWAFKLKRNTGFATHAVNTGQKFSNKIHTIESTIMIMLENTYLYLHNINN